jgi:putative SOS response-associated peptidase YedK
MCYDIKASLESQLRRAEFISDEIMIKELREKLKPFIETHLYHASGYAHPKTLIYSDKEPYIPIVSVWGLVPHWIKDNNQRMQFWNNTLNARGETIFEKPSFRDSAKNKRCIIVLDGFYEHHHFNGKTYPFLIQKKSKEPLTIAGLWSEWLDKETGEIINSFTIVTTKANKLLAKIHNNPKLAEPRMPVILDDTEIEQWLQRIETEADKKIIEEVLRAYPAEELEAYTVHKLRGKNAFGNVPESTVPMVYEELELEID